MEKEAIVAPTDPFEAKMAILRAFMDKWRDLPPQRSPQWYADRLYSIGASELGTLLGVNPFQSIRKMIAQKVELAEFGDKRAANWGNVLEHVCGAYMEIVFQCELFEMGSIPTHRMRGQRSSPDGVAVIKCLGNVIVSFEFKAPQKRIPKGYVPPYYRPQVLACLCAIEPSDLGLFVDTVIRRCAPADWTFESRDYDYDYHDEINLGDPLALTCLFFYRANGADKTDGAGDSPINMGTCPPDVFDRMLADTAERKLLKVTYGAIHLDTDKPPDLAAALLAHPECVGYLPLKIMQCHVIPVKKEPDYVLQFQPLIDRIIGVVRAITDAPADKKMGTFISECEAAGWFKTYKDPV